MSKSQYVSQLAVGHTVASRFCVTDQQPSNGRAPHKFTLRDRTGDIPAILWPRTATVRWAEIEGACYAEIHGVVEYNHYAQGPQVTVETFAAVPEPEDLSDYVPVGPRDPDQMWEEFRVAAASVCEPTLSALLARLAADDGFRRALIDAPAAQRMHHAYRGGLLEHSLEVVRLVDALAGVMPLNRDLLVTAALLHDIGKLEEIDYHSPVFGWTAAGGFMGHVFLGAERVRQALQEVQAADEEVCQLLCHLLLSHHGRPEWGAAVRPCVLEAMVLHACDNLSANRFHVEETVRQRRSGAPFQWCRALEGNVYTGAYPRGEPDPPRPERVREEAPTYGEPAGMRLEQPPEERLVDWLPLLGQVAAGVPVEEQAEIEGYYPVPRPARGPGGDYLLRVHGDSMVGAHIDDGDVVVVRAGGRARDGDVVVALVDGESTVKHLVYEDGQALLRPANPAYGDIRPGSDLSIQGTVVGVLRGVL